MSQGLNNLRHSESQFNDILFQNFTAINENNTDNINNSWKKLI